MPAKTGEIIRVTDDLAEVMAAQEFSPAAIREFSFAVKESMENVIRQGYRGRSGEIGVRCTGTPEKITVEISDSAPPYNPLQPAKKDGEPGMAFVREAADIVTYRHQNHRNVLTLVKIRRA